MKTYLVRLSGKDADTVDVEAERHDNEGGDLVFFGTDGNVVHRFSERAWVYVVAAARVGDPMLGGIVDSLEEVLEDVYDEDKDAKGMTFDEERLADTEKA